MPPPPPPPGPAPLRGPGAAGVFTLLLGPPGSGKSTYLQALAGRLKRSHSLQVRAGAGLRGWLTSALQRRRCRCIPLWASDGES